MTALVPGTFDPITMGHLDVIQRAARLFNHVIVAVGENPSKRPWFTTEERCELARGACAHLPNVEVDTFAGLLVQYAQSRAARVIVKGLRAVSDYEYESQMAQANRLEAPAVETLFVMTSARYSFLSSSIVRELALFGGQVQSLVPGSVVEPLRTRAAERSREGA